MTHTKNRCLKSTLAIAIASTFCNPGFAQDTPTDDMEVIAVTGIRQSLTEAMGIKKESSTVVDAISAEDVGKFPDINVANPFNVLQVSKSTAPAVKAPRSIYGACLPTSCLYV